MLSGMVLGEKTLWRKWQHNRGQSNKGSPDWGSNNGASICIISGYKYTSYQIEKCTTKAIAFVEKIGYMLQRQIVKGLGKQIDIEDPAYRKYAGTSFQSIVWMLIFDIVTIKRNAAVQ